MLRGPLTLTTMNAIEKQMRIALQIKRNVAESLIKIGYHISCTKEGSSQSSSRERC